MEISNKQIEIERNCTCKCYTDFNYFSLEQLCLSVQVIFFSKCYDSKRIESTNTFQTMLKLTYYLFNTTYLSLLLLLDLQLNQCIISLLCKFTSVITACSPYTFQLNVYDTSLYLFIKKVVVQTTTFIMNI